MSTELFPLSNNTVGEIHYRTPTEDNSYTQVIRLLNVTSPRQAEEICRQAGVQLVTFKTLTLHTTTIGTTTATPLPETSGPGVLQAIARAQKRPSDRGMEPDGHYIVARDREGLVRLNNGKGQIVALTTHTRQDVQEWRNLVVSEHYQRIYQAVLDLFDTEAQPTTDQTTPKETDR